MVDEGAARAALRDALRALPSAIGAIADPAAFQAIADRFAREALALVRRPSSPEAAARGGEAYLSLELPSPIEAAELADLWGLPTAFAVSTDARMAYWYLSVPEQVAHPSGGTYRVLVPPVFGAVRVAATLDRVPEVHPGYEGEPYGTAWAFDLRRVRASVRWIAFWPRPAAAPQAAAPQAAPSQPAAPQPAAPQPAAPQAAPSQPAAPQASAPQAAASPAVVVNVPAALAATEPVFKLPAVMRIPEAFAATVPANQGRAAPPALPPLTRGTQVKFVAGIHAGETGVVIADQQGDRVTVDVEPHEDGLIVHSYDRASVAPHPRAPASISAMLHEVRDAFGARGYRARKAFWWAARLPGGEGASDDALRVIHEQYEAVRRAVDAERVSAFVPVMMRFRDTFGHLDDAARDAAWRRERAAWIESPGAAEIVRELSLSVGLVPEADPKHVAREAVMSRASRLHTRAALAALRGRPPRERNAALEAAIQAAPDDPAGYVAYAAWLERREDPRAELINLQATGAESWQLTEFFEDHWADLLGDLALHFPYRAGRLAFRLGFISWAKVTVGRDEAERGVRAADIVAKLGAHPSGRFLRRLWLEGDGLRAEDAAAAISVEGLPLLRSVALVGADVTADFITTLVEPVRRRRLPILDLARSKVGERAAAALIVHAQRLDHLERLDVPPAEIGDAMLDRLRRECPALSVERALELAAVARGRAAR